MTDLSQSIVCVVSTEYCDYLTWGHIAEYISDRRNRHWLIRPFSITFDSFTLGFNGRVRVKTISLKTKKILSIRRLSEVEFDNCLDRELASKVNKNME